MKTEVIQINPEAPEEEKVEKAARVIRESGLVIIPTETVYGIAASVLDAVALKRLSAVKERPKDKPFSLHIASVELTEKYTQEILPSGYRLMEKFWPGPLTLIFQSPGKNKIGIRMPNHKAALAIIEEAGVPIVCPSANLSGKVAPSTCQEALEDLEGLVDLAVDSGKTVLQRESTVVDVTELPVKILRQGAIPLEQITQLANKKIVLFVCSGNSCRSVMAEAYLKQKFKESGRQDIEVSSAGVLLLSGLRVSEYTCEILKREGIDVSSHISQWISPGLIKKSDLVLVMEKFQEERVLQLCPEAKKRVFLLKEFAKISGDNLDISDPIGRPIEEYAETFRIIKRAVDRLADLI